MASIRKEPGDPFWGVREGFDFACDSRGDVEEVRESSVVSQQSCDYRGSLYDLTAPDEGAVLPERGVFGAEEGTNEVVVDVGCGEN